MTSAGINISKYTSNTTRHASSSKAYYAGVNVDQVMLRAGWTNVSSFVTHYNLPIATIQKPANIAARQAITHMSKSAKPSQGKLYTRTHVLRLKTAKNVRARKLVEAAQKKFIKKDILFQDEPFVSPPPIVPRVKFAQPTSVLVSRVIRTEKGKYKTVQQKIMCKSWPADQVVRIHDPKNKVVTKVFRNPTDHDDSDTE